MPLINVSIGEIVDKMTILEIKSANASDEKLSYIKDELDYLARIVTELQISSSHIDNLREINKRLWNIEDEIRVCESHADFSDKFVQLARSVYITNDKRFKLKNDINEYYDSVFKEQKILPIYDKEVGNSNE